ncbi:MAG: subtilisin family serine protease [Myxococcota bacterium]|jgi:subtilisin family serine protease
MLMLLLIGAATASDVWWFTGEGPETATLDNGVVGGTSARLTGRLVAKASDPGALEALPEVDRVWPLAGDRDLVVVHPAPGVDEVALSRALRDRPDVRWAHPDIAWKLEPATLPDDPYVASQWHLENDGENGSLVDVDIDAETAWVFATGKGQTIAILDTGVDLDHPDLNVVSGWDYIDKDGDSSPDRSYDGWPHGTASAGVAAAIGNNGIGGAGVAYDADLYAIKMLGGYLSDAEMYEAFVEAVDAGASVLSNSWGASDECANIGVNVVYEEGLDYVEKEGRGGLGSVFVQSAGNSGCDFSSNGAMVNKAVVAVGAIDSRDRRVGYSSYGALLDIVAPTGLLTTDASGPEGWGPYGEDDDHWRDYTGTSASAPVVAGVFALMFEANPRLTAKRARQVLRSTAEKIDVPNGAYDAEGWSPYYGWGRVDAGAAVLAVVNEAPLAPQVVAPGAEAPEDAVVIAWEPAIDGDSDALSYEIDWWYDAFPNQVKTLDVDGTQVDVSDLVQSGEILHFQVAAVDMWGRGPLSEPQQVLAVDPPVRPDPEVVRVPAGGGEDPGGCDQAGGTSGLEWTLGALSRR